MTRWAARAMLFIAGWAVACLAGASTAPAAEPWAAPGSARDGYVIFASVDHADGLYAAGEKVTFTIRLTRDGKPVDSAEVSYDVVGNGAADPLTKGTAPVKAGAAMVTIEHRGPICLTLTARYMVNGTNEILFKAGAAVDAGGLRPCVAEPADFEAFWAEQRRRLAAMPMNARLTPVPNDPTADKYPGVEVESFDVQADCPGGMPLSGYLSRPKGAKPKSLPATIHLHSAGVHGSDLRYTTAIAKGKRLAMDINAHGIPNGRPAEYYQKLNSTTLRGYGYKGLENRDTAYLLGMYLRIMRAIEFLASQPEWDGKTIIAAGTSQGGGQALVAAGLDPRVTLISAGCPTFCNLSAGAVGQAAGFPFGRKKLGDKELATVAYFDACYLAKRARAAAVLRVGLIDEVCWPAGMFAAYNALPGRKFLVTAPTTHSPWCPPELASKAQSEAGDLFRTLQAEMSKQ